MENLTVKISVIEDNVIHAKHLRTILDKWQVGYTHCRFVFSFFYTEEDVIKNISTVMESDLILMDVELSHSTMSGIEIAKILRKRNYTRYIVLVTSHSEYLAEGYDIEAFQFVNKPVTYEKIDKIMTQFLQKIRRKSFSIEIYSRSYVIDFYSILYFTIQGHYITLKSDKEIPAFKENISQLEKQLPEFFIQCHKSFIVNMEKIHWFDRSNIFLVNNETIPIGRKYLSNLREKYKQFVD